MRTGQVSDRVPVRGDGDPLDDLSRLFNGMLDRIESLIAGLQGSLDNVAHDLRTPLARLRGAAEGALRDGADAEALRARAGRGAGGEPTASRRRSTTLMDISEAENGAMALRRERLDAREPLRETVELYEDVAEEKGIALALEAPEGLARLRRPRPAAAGPGQPGRQRAQVHPAGRARAPFAPAAEGPCGRLRVRGRRPRHLRRRTCRGSGTASIAATRAARSGAWGWA